MHSDLHLMQDNTRKGREMETLAIIILLLAVVLFAMGLVYVILAFVQGFGSRLAARFFPQSYSRYTIRSIERGDHGPMALLALYRERVIERSSRQEQLERIGKFSYDKMYIPLKVEVNRQSSESVLEEPEKILRRYASVAILGGPGAGKTTLLRYLELASAGGLLPGVPDIPVFIPLSEFAQEKVELADYIVRLIAVRDQVSFTRQQLDGWLAGGLILLLLDGLDELGFDTKQQQDTVAQILNLRQTYPGVSVVVSCRTSSWESSGLFDQSIFLEATIPPLDETSIRRFIVARFPTDASDQVEMLYRSIRNSQSLYSLAQTPLFLTLMVAIHRDRGRLPVNRLHLYEEFTDLLMHRWDELRSVDRSLRVPPRIKYQLLKRLGLCLHERRQTSIASSELLHVIGEWFPVGLYGPSAEILLEIENAHGMLVKQGGFSYEYRHVALQEYYAALQIADETKVPDFLFIDLYDPWWREVVLLLAALGKYEQIISAILRDARTTEVGSLRLSKLTFAVQCAESAGLRDTMILRDLFHELVSLFRIGDANEKYQAAVTLLSLRSLQARDFVEQIAFSSQKSSEREAAALALAESGASDERLLDVLVEALHSEDDNTRGRAAFGLGEIGDARVMTVLMEALPIERSSHVRIEILRAVNRIVQPSKLDTSSLAVFMKALRSGQFDQDPEVQALNSEILSRLSSQIREWSASSHGR